MSPDRSCFVIMPFGGHFDSRYDSVYAPAIAEAGLKPRRGDDLFAAGHVLAQIWSTMRGADVVLADLSGRNPNVFYELGLSHALALPTVLVTDDPASLPFDVRSLRCIGYETSDPTWPDKLRASVTKALRQVMAAPNSAVLAPFLNAPARGSAEEITRQEKALIEMRQAMESLVATLKASRRDRLNIRAGGFDAEYIAREYRDRGAPRIEAERALDILGLTRKKAEKITRDIYGRAVLPFLDTSSPDGSSG